MKKREYNLLRLKKVLLNDKSNVDSTVTEILDNALYETLSQFFEFNKDSLNTVIDINEKNGYTIKIEFSAEKVKEFGKVV